MAAVDAKRLCSRGADYFNCRLMPHGGVVLFPVVLSSLGLAASLADDGCDYARVTGAAVEMLTGSPNVPYVDAGMTAYRVPGFYPSENSWRVVYTDECQSYQYMNLIADSSWVAAQWLRFFGLVAGGTTAMFLWTSACLTLRPNYWRAAGAGAALTCLCHLCSFVWFYTRLCHTSTTNFLDFEAGREVETSAKSDTTSSCVLFFGSKCSITSCVLWGAASAMILLREYPAPVPKLVAREEVVAMVRPQVAASAQSLSGGGSSRRDICTLASKRKGGKGGGDRSFRSSVGSSAGQSSGGSVPWVSGAPLSVGGDDPNFRESLRTSMRPATAHATRPTELSGSTMSAVSFV